MVVRRTNKIKYGGAQNKLNRTKYCAEQIKYNKALRRTNYMEQNIVLYKVYRTKHCTEQII